MPSPEYPLPIPAQRSPAVAEISDEEIMTEPHKPSGEGPIPGRLKPPCANNEPFPPDVIVTLPMDTHSTPADPDALPPKKLAPERNMETEHDSQMSGDGPDALPF
jgi:hypothetical protein